MKNRRFDDILEGLQSGTIVPYLGPGVLSDVMSPEDGRRIPAEDESLILALTRGQPLNQRLMIEFPRAAMHIELKKGRKSLTTLLTDLYGKTTWSGGAVHQWLASLSLPYVIDTNRDVQLQELWASRPHTLVVGIARLSADPYRFRIWQHDGSTYREISVDAIDPRLPVLFKPLGTPRPEPTFVASDADFVDYITELMGGFAVPRPVKELRVGKQYLILGLSLVRDTQRMILSDLIVDSAPRAGWALIAEPTAKERRYCVTKGIEIIESGLSEFLAAAGITSLALAL
jgi:hypothetical protein